MRTDAAGAGATEEDGGDGADYFEFAVERSHSTLRRKTLAQQLRDARMQSDPSVETCLQQEEASAPGEAQETSMAESASEDGSIAEELEREDSGLL